MTNKILVTLVAATFTFAGSAFAQSRTVVSFSDGASCNGAVYGPPTFVASALALKTTAPAPVGASGQEARASRVTFDDIAVSRTMDDCSISLYTLLFQGQHVRTITISLQSFTGGAYKEVTRISLSEGTITSIADDQSAAAPFTERVLLGFRTITIVDVASGKTTSATR